MLHRTLSLHHTIAGWCIFHTLVAGTWMEDYGIEMTLLCNCTNFKEALCVYNLQYRYKKDGFLQLAVKQEK